MSKYIRVEICISRIFSGPKGPFILAVFRNLVRNLVREIWFEKSGSRNLVREKWLTRKKNTFLEPLFYTFLENWLRNKWLTEYFSLLQYLPIGYRTINTWCFFHTWASVNPQLSLI